MTNELTDRPEIVLPDLTNLLPQLRGLGLHDVDVRVTSDGGWLLDCRIEPEIEDEYRPKQEIGVALMHAARAAGSWVDDITFRVANAR